MTDHKKLEIYCIFLDIFEKHDDTFSDEKAIYVIDKMEEELNGISFYGFIKRFEEINEIFSNLNREYYELEQKQKVEKELI